MGMENYLIQQMEVKRKEMIRSASIYGFTSSETVTCSQELDRLINTYQFLFSEGGKVPIQTLDYAN